MQSCACAHLLLIALLPAIVGPAVGEVVLTLRDGGGGAAALGGETGGPEFVPRQQTMVRGFRGGNVTLNCRVMHLGDKAVSWVRSRDLQILSHGGLVFTADARVSVPSSLSSLSAASSHALTINRLRDSDAGRYECQLNTEPKMSLFFDLIVLDPAEAEAVLATSTEASPWASAVEVWAATAEVTAVAGEHVELSCAARLLYGLPVTPDIRWEREGEPLQLQEGLSESRVAEARSAQSTVRLAHVRPRDAGRYACVVGDVRADIVLQVSDAENGGEMEAMQRDQGAGGSAGRGPVPSGFPLLLILLVALTVRT